MRIALSLAAIVFVAAAGPVSAQPVSVTVDADTITYDSAQQVVTALGNVRIVARRHRVFADAARYDLRAEIVTATGRVRFIDPQGRELRGRQLTYNTRTEEGVMEPAEGLIDIERRVHLRAGRIEFTPQRVRSVDSFVTSCDPEKPFLHVTARRIEVIPLEELVAYDASVYLAGRRIYSTARFAVSLVPGEEGVLLPGFGYNEVDRYWLDARARVRLAGARGQVHMKHGTESGTFALLTLARRDPQYTTTLRLGRTQTRDDRKAFNLLPYYVAQATAESAPVRIFGTPLSWTVLGAAGWFHDQTAGVQTTRLDGQITLRTDPIVLAPRLTLAADAGFQVSIYGTGSVRTLATGGVRFTQALDAYSRITLGYTLRDTRGPSPLMIDDVDRESTFSLGISRIVPDRYRLSARVGYNTLVPETTLGATVAYVLSPSWEVAVSAVYNFRQAAFSDVDYAIRRICDCVDVVVRYRQIQREVAIEFGLVGFADRRAPFVPRTATRAGPPPPGGNHPEGGDQH